ncbi:MAG TPA: branched-chain amino acid ABC transporter permease, partial [Candidatus Dormibacteraeota bacterium]|nr:branched-chain amino acid ABC transporter permease [Candidatus Dormibacteraeota bacterium]
PADSPKQHRKESNAVNLYVAAFGFGLVSMSVIAIAAVGFTMQFGITNMINLAYGEVMISSAYVAYYMNRVGISIWIGLIGGALFGAVFSFLLNRIVYAPFMRKGTSHIGMVIVSLAISLMIANLLLPLVGYYSVSYQNSTGDLVRIGSIVLTTDQIAIMVVAVVLMLGIHALLRYTRLGKAMRATSANPTLARNCGIPTQRVIDTVWLITGALCGMAGVVAAMNSDSFAIANGAGFLITVLAAAVLGGAGQPYGAMIGAVLIGLITELSAATWSPQYKEVVAFGILVLVMVLRPQGLLAKRGALAAAG